MQQNTINPKVRVLWPLIFFSFPHSTYNFNISLQPMHSAVSFGCRHFTRPLFQILHHAKTCDCKLQTCQARALVCGSGWEKPLDPPPPAIVMSWIKDGSQVVPFLFAAITASSHQRPLVHGHSSIHVKSGCFKITCKTLSDNLVVLNYFLEDGSRDGKPAHLQAHQSICQIRQSINNCGSTPRAPHLSSWHTKQTQSRDSVLKKKYLCFWRPNLG